MKFAVFLAVLFAFSMIVWPQESVIEPDFNDVFYRLDTGRLLPLERQTGVLKSVSKGLVVMSMKQEIELAGKKSPVRFKAGDIPFKFVVRFPLSLANQDPETMYHLRKLFPQKDKREALISSSHASPAGISVNNTSQDGLVPLAFKRYGSSSYEITTGVLSPGEYGFAYVLSGYTVFCFAIDK